ncbi:hypothetical protein RSAG8_09107, partial [Rhizoctonia solani AG-8 WAC10335]
MKTFSFVGLLGLVGLTRAAVLCGGAGQFSCLAGREAATIQTRADVPAGAITIGSGGKYSTISAALQDTSSNIYYIYSGTYSEQIYINRANVKIYGQTSSKLDYNSNTVTITNSLSAATDFHLIDCFTVGSQASIWITKSTIETVESGYITASGRDSDDANYYVIDSSTIKGTGSCYLGRPWREYARVIFQNSSLGSNIIAAGWQIWSDATPNTAHVYYGEYNNSGAGAWNSQRVSFATRMSSPISISTVLGSTSWVDSAYL